MFRGKYDVKTSVQKVKTLTQINKKNYKFDINAMRRINQQKGITMFGDVDKDGVMNIVDCQPLNKFKQGNIHDLLGKDKNVKKEMDKLNEFYNTGQLNEQDKPFFDIGSLNYINKQIIELDEKIKNEKDPKIKKALIEQKNELYKQYRHIYDIERRDSQKREVSYPEYLKATTEYERQKEMLPYDIRLKELEAKRQQFDLTRRRQEYEKNKQLIEQEKKLMPVKALSEYKKIEAQDKLAQMQLLKTQKEIELAETERQLKKAEIRRSNAQTGQKMFDEKLTKYGNAVNILTSNKKNLQNLKETHLNIGSESIVRNNIDAFVGRKKQGLDVLRSAISNTTSYPLNSVAPKTPEQAENNRNKVTYIAGGMFKNSGLSAEEAFFQKQQNVGRYNQNQGYNQIQSQGFGVVQTQEQEQGQEQNVSGQNVLNQNEQQINSQQTNFKPNPLSQERKEQYAREIVEGGVNYEDIDWDNISIDDIERVDPKYAEYLKSSAGKHKYRRGPYKKH